MALHIFALQIARVLSIVDILGVDLDAGVLVLAAGRGALVGALKPAIGGDGLGREVAGMGVMRLLLELGGTLDVVDVELTGSPEVLRVVEGDVVG